MSQDDALFSSFFNVGVRSGDIQAEVEFLTAFGPEEVERIERKASFGPKEITAVTLGGVRFFIFQDVIYDQTLRERNLEFGPGVAHLSFLTQDTSRLVETLGQQGVEPLMEPYESNLKGHGRRRVAFFRSPNGTVLESQQLLD